MASRRRLAQVSLAYFAPSCRIKRWSGRANSGRAPQRRALVALGEFGMPLKAVTQVLAVLGAALTVGIALYAAQGAESSTLLFLILVLLWACSPYAALLFLARRTSSGPWCIALPICVLATMLFGLYFFWQGFFVQPDPQSGLLFVFLPFYQLAFVGVVFVIGVLTKAWQGRERV